MERGAASRTRHESSECSDAEPGGQRRGRERTLPSVHSYRHTSRSSDVTIGRPRRRTTVRPAPTWPSMITSFGYCELANVDAASPGRTIASTKYPTIPAGCTVNLKYVVSSSLPDSALQESMMCPLASPSVRTGRVSRLVLRRKLACGIVAAFALLAPYRQSKGEDEHSDVAWAELSDMESAYPYLPGSNREQSSSWWAVRIVDDCTGLPIPGARVSIPFRPHQGVPRPEHHMLAEAIADEEGWARMRFSALKGWRTYGFADAVGYASSDTCLPGGADECRLLRGVDVPVVVLDLFGRPVAGAELAVNSAFGDVPDQRRAWTDAAGQAVLRSIDPNVRPYQNDVWIDAPGVYRAATRLRRAWSQGDSAVEIDAFPGGSVVGRILGADDSPVAHATVGVAGRSRPWTRSDQDGGFRLVGTAPWDEIEFRLPPSFEIETGTFTSPPEGTPRIVRVDASGSRLSVNVDVGGDDIGPAAHVRVVLVRRTDGYTSTTHTDDEGRVTLEVPPGDYLVLVDGELGAWGAAEATLEVGLGKRNAIAVNVPRNPTVTVDASRAHDLWILLATPSRFRALELPRNGELQHWKVPVPSKGPSRFWVATRGWGERIATSIQVPEPGGNVAIDLPPATVLRAALVGPDGLPTDGDLSVERPGFLRMETASSTRESGMRVSPLPSVETRLVGTVRWCARPMDPDLAWVYGSSHIRAAGTVIDLGEVRLVRRVATEVQVDVPDGVEITREAKITCLQAGVRGTVHARLLPGGRADPTDTMRWPPLNSGTVVKITGVGRHGHRVFHRTMHGPPPWRLVWPPQRLLVEVRDARDEHLPLGDALLVLDGDLLGPAWAGDQPTLFHGIEEGWHTLTVIAPGRVAQRCRLKISREETRRLSVRLSPNA